MKIISSTQFCDLIKSNKKKAESFFPELIHRLIKKTCNVDCYTRFPNGDANYTKGWDGTVKNNRIESRFIPIDNSFWELGTNSNSLEKIKKDYNRLQQKRQADYHRDCLYS